jgi:predicted nucleic acid-binding protein
MNVCLDACFLIGLYDDRDEHHARSRELLEQLFDEGTRNVAVIIWPVLYESVSTRLVRDSRKTQAMERELKTLASTGRLAFIEDDSYRAEALELCFQELRRPRFSYRGLSLTDRVIRAVLADSNARVDALLTFNPGDFADVCRSAQKLVLS